MNLKNMEMSDEERAEYNGSLVADQPKYPYGLCLYLDDDAIEKLGFPALPQVGQKMMIMARVEVVSVSESENKGSEKEQRMSLQITDMAIGPDKEEKSAAQVVYGS